MDRRPRGRWPKPQASARAGVLRTRWANWLPPASSRRTAAPFVRNATKRGEGTQIDLLVQTRTALHVVEIKRRALISASVEDEVREKIKRLRVPRGLSVRTALVYAGELAPEVAERGYFDALVPVERLLGLPVRQ